jgi:hypothetical protein
MIRELPTVAVVSLAALLFVSSGCRAKRTAQEQQEPEASTPEAVAEAATPLPKPFGNLTSMEPSIAGLQSGMDTTSVQAILGLPVLVSTMPDLDKPGSWLLLWHYRSVIVHYDYNDELGAVEIVGPGVRTSRGIAVGDSLTAVLAAYGQPARADGVLFHFQDRSDIENGDALIFRVQEAKVTSIYAGHVFE